MIIAIAEKCEFVTQIKKKTFFYIIILFIYNFTRQWSLCDEFCVYFGI